jgi:hypothetical protein
MAQVSGIKIEKSCNGTPLYARINLKKYGNELMPFLKEKGVELEKKKASTVKLPRGYMTIEDARIKGLAKINELCDKYGID